MRTILARNYTPTPGTRSKRLIVVHDMEAPEGATTAEAVGLYFARQARGSSGSSAHVGADTDSLCRYVNDDDVAWAAPGMNHDGLHLELAGYARQTEAEWHDPASRAVLANGAKQAAAWAVEYGIPLRWVTDAQLADKSSRGFTTHRQGTRVLNGGRGHTDPGPHFPLALFLELVAHELEPARPSPAPHRPAPVHPPAPAPVHHGDPWVLACQRAAGLRGAALDGKWGPVTAKAVVHGVQYAAGLRGRNVDGVWGPGTTRAVHALHASAQRRPRLRIAGVYALQRAVGFTGDSVDGLWGPKTAQGVEHVRQLVHGPAGV